MKKLLFPLLYLSLVCIFISACKKESKPNDTTDGPDMTALTGGFLCTMGIGREGIIDTLTYEQTSVAREMTVYYSDYLRDEDELMMTTNGNNTVTIKRKIPWVNGSRSFTYFGIEENTNPLFSAFPDNACLWNFPHESASTKTEFIIQRSADDINKFTLESAVYRGNFLGTAKWRNASYPTEARLVYTGTPQKFFFVTK
jgi:hypothetical protein